MKKTMTTITMTIMMIMTIKNKGKNKNHGEGESEEDLFDDEYNFSGSELKLYKGPFDRLPAPLFFREIISEIPDSIKALIPAKKQKELEEIFNKWEEFVKNN